MAFDPDAYLKSQQQEFDPDAYLASTAVADDIDRPESFNIKQAFKDALTVSLAEKPALQLEGATAYTKGEAFGVDPLLRKGGEALRGIASEEKQARNREQLRGKLWPTRSDTPWYDLDANLVPNTINSWAAQIGDQIPIMFSMIVGSKITEAAGTALGATIGPVTAKVGGKVGKIVGGAIPMVLLETGSYLQSATNLNIDKDIAEKWARRYGPLAGLIEFAQHVWNAGALGRWTKGADKKFITKALKEIGGNVWEGLEEVSQGGLERHFLNKAIAEMKERHPDFEAEKQEILGEESKREFAIGIGIGSVSSVTGKTVSKGLDIISRTDVARPEAPVIGDKGVIDTSGLPALTEDQVVHTMPDGTVMAGPEHKGAVPGSERIIEAEPTKEVKITDTPKIQPESKPAEGKDVVPTTEVVEKKEAPEPTEGITEAKALKPDFKEERQLRELEEPGAIIADKDLDALETLALPDIEKDIKQEPTEGKVVTDQEALIKEAKKFETVEEFVKSQTKGVASEFKVGDVLDPQGKTNMRGEITIREIEGNTIKFTDSTGKEFAGMARSTVRNLIKGKSWKRVSDIERLTKSQLTDIWNKAQAPTPKAEVKEAKLKPAKKEKPKVTVGKDLPEGYQERVEKFLPPETKKEAPQEKAKASPISKANTSKEVDESVSEVIQSSRQDDIKAARELIGLDKIASKDRKDFQQMINEGVSQGVPDKALNIANEVLKTDRILTDAEIGGFSAQMIKLRTEYNKLMRERAKLKNEHEINSLTVEMDRIQSEFDTISEANDKSGTEAARSLVARKITLNEAWDIVSVKYAARKAKGDALTKKEIAEFEKLVKELEEKDTAIDELEAKMKIMQATRVLREGKIVRYRGMSKTQKATELTDLITKTKELMKQGC